MLWLGNGLCCNIIQVMCLHWGNCTSTAMPIKKETAEVGFRCTERLSSQMPVCWISSCWVSRRNVSVKVQTNEWLLANKAVLLGIFCPGQRPTSWAWRRWRLMETLLWLWLLKQDMWRMWRFFSNTEHLLTTRTARMRVHFSWVTTTQKRRQISLVSYKQSSRYHF